MCNRKAPTLRTRVGAFDYVALLGGLRHEIGEVVLEDAGLHEGVVAVSDVGDGKQDEAGVGHAGDGGFGAAG